MEKDMSQSLFDLIAVALHSPDTTEVTDGDKQLLFEIKKLVSGAKYSLEDELNAEESNDHRSVYGESSNIDCVTVSFAIKELINTNAVDRFFAPLIGGKKFLRHILICKYCLMRCAISDADYNNESAVAVAAKNVLSEFAKSGATINFKERELKKAIKLSRKN